MPKYGSLFAGVGGFDIGFDAAGWQCGFQVEWDNHCQQVLAYHWPDVPKWWDVSDVNGAVLPPVDLITFGSPCQDLSLAGKRAGLEGSRSNLFFQATRIIKEMRDATNGQYPRWAIWENVAGAFSSNGGKDFDAVLQEMVNIGGHHVEWHCLDAQFFGVPQRRRRVFVIACFDPSILNRGGQAVLPVGEGRRRNTSTRNKKGEDTPLPFGKSVATGGTELGSGDSVANTLSASLYHHGTVVNQDANNGHVVIEPYVKVVRSGARDADGNLPAEVWRDNEVAPTLNVFDNTGESRATVVVTEPVLIDGTRADEQPVLMRQREGKPGGGKDPLLSDTSLTLAGSNDQVLFQPVDGVIGFSHTQGLDAQPSDETFPTLRSGGAGQAVAIPIDDVREIEKHQNGSGIGQEGDPAYTLDTMSAPGVAVAYTTSDIVGTLTAHDFKGVGNQYVEEHKLIVEPEVAPTLRSGGDGGVPSSRGEHLVVEAYDEYNDKLGGDVHHALRAGTKQSTGVLVDDAGGAMIFEPGALSRVDGKRWSTDIAHTLRSNMGDNHPAVLTEPNMVVRRLTPVECERLMGWPDNHTLYRADGKTNSDTTRYKMCGNGVASPVAQWIAEHIHNVHISL